MADSTSQKIIQYVGDISDVLQSLNTLNQANQRIASNIGQNFSQSARNIGASFGKISKTEILDNKGALQSITVLDRVSQKIKDTDGSLGQFTQTIKTNKDGTKSVTNEFQKLDQNTVSLGDNISRLVKRAALTIPVWFALRGSISALNTTIRDGISAIVEQDRALQKAKLNIQGTADSIDANFGVLKKAALELSLKTGKSVETIINSFQRFATVGFDFETSLQGANGAVKLSTLLFGDATEEANAFARSMRVLVDRSDSTASAGQQIQEAMALTAELWKNNAFEVNDFTNDLEKFAGTAKTTNITTQETISLLATLSTAGLRNRGGQLLRTSIQKLLENLDKLAGTLGVRVNPQLDTTFSVLFKVITELDRLQQTTGSLGPATQAIADIFGGVRGGETIRALISLRGELQKNISILPDLKKFNNEFEEQNKQINRLVEQFHNVNREIGKAFVVGITGGDDFRDSLEKIVITLKDIQKNAENAGIGFRNLWNTIEFVANIPTFGASNINITSIFDVQKAYDNTFKQIDNKNQELFDKIIKGVRGQLNRVELERLIAELNVQLKLPPTESLLDKYELDKSVLQNVLESLNNQLNEEQKKNSLTIKPEIVIELSKQQDIAKLLLADELSRLKIQGASNSEILKSTDILSKKFGIEEQSIDILERQLEKEKAINEEKRLQSRLGSDSIKLFKIAQEQGVDIARQIGEVLAGNVDFESFIRNGNKAAEIFKDQFSDLFESKQAEQFFRGERISTLQKKGTSGFDFNIFQNDKQKIELSKLKGGESIAIQEEAIRGLPEQRFSDATIRFAEAVNIFKQIELTKANQPVTQLINGTNQLNNIKLQELQKAQANKNLINYPSKPGTLTNLDLTSGSRPKIDLNFSEGSFTIRGITLEEQQKAIENTLKNMGTPGTRENKTLQRALFGTNQTI